MPQYGQVKSHTGYEVEIAVESVFGRTGSIAKQFGDYSYNDLTDCPTFGTGDPGEVLEPGQAPVVDTDGKLPKSVIPNQPFIISIWWPGQVFGRTPVVYIGNSEYNVVIPAGLTGSKADIGTNPSTTKVYSFKKNGVEFGTLSVASNGALTWTSAAGATFGDNDKFTIVEPTEDSSLANVSLTIKATRGLAA